MKSHQKITLATVCSALVIFNFASCKYEEGPKLTFKSKNARLVGDWKVTGIPDADLKDHNIDFSFSDDNSFLWTDKFTYDGTNYTEKTEGSWEWSDDKKSIEIIIKENGVNKDTASLDIVRLASDEFIYTDEIKQRWTLTQ